MNPSTDTQAISRTVQGTQVPITGTWAVDTDHTEVSFVARHMMVAKVRGRIPVVAGGVVIAEDPAQSTVVVTLGTSGVDTGSADRDAHLRSSDFFDTDVHPTATFASTAVQWYGTRALVDGQLTIKGISRPVTLDVEYLGVASDPDGAVRAAFSATTEVDREDWSISWNQGLETGGVLIGRKVRIEIDLQTVLAS